MRRKIVRQGKATMTISLPAEWIHKYSLKDGDELELEEIGNRIEITTGKVTGDRKAEIDSRKFGKFTKRDLSHLYILGYDEITIFFDNEEVLQEIKERLPDCIGYEIIDQTENKIVVKSISSALDEEFDVILRKVFLILKEMSEKIYESMKNKEFSRLKQIRDMETINNKFTSFLLRLLNKKGYKKQNRTLQAYDMIQNLERLADEYKYLCDNYAESKEAVDKKALDLLKEVNDYFHLLYSLHYQNEPAKMVQLHAKRKALTEAAGEMLRKGKESLLNHHMTSLVEKIYNTAGSYLALAIE
jgi:phosphate uptake regulator